MRYSTELGTGRTRAFEFDAAKFLTDKLRAMSLDVDGLMLALEDFAVRAYGDKSGIEQLVGKWERLHSDLAFFIRQAQRDVEFHLGEAKRLHDEYKYRLDQINVLAEKRQYEELVRRLQVVVDETAQWAIGEVANIPTNPRKGWFVYFLFDAGVLAYIGKSENVLGRLGTHASPSDKKQWDSWGSIELRSKTEMDNVERALIWELRPRDNRKIDAPTFTLPIELRDRLRGSPLFLEGLAA